MVDVQPENQLREKSIALAKNLSVAERENGASDEHIVRYAFCARAQWHGRQLPSFRPLPRNLKAMCGIALAAYWQRNVWITTILELEFLRFLAYKLHVNPAEYSINEPHLGC